MRFVALMMMVLAAPVSPENVEKARQLVEQTARTFYDRWGARPADDNRLAADLMTPALGADVARRRASCTRPGTCVDPVTCMVGRAVVEKAAFAPGSTTTRLNADVHLRGAGGTTAVARWVLDVTPRGTRLAQVSCAPASSGDSTATTPTAPPTPPTTTTMTTTGAAAGLTIARAPATEDERAAARFLQQAIAAGNDKNQIRGMVSRFTKDNIRSYIEQQKRCIESERNGDPVDIECIGNGLTCGAEKGATLTRFHGYATLMELTLMMPDSTVRELSYYVENGSVYGVRGCFDRTPSNTPPTSASTGTGVFNQGHCSGTASCSGSCTETGCYRGRFVACMGSPVPCAGRSQGACYGSCYWVQ